MYMYFRDYDPATGRFPQSDPIGQLGGVNTYAYVSGNPLGLIDPFGLKPGDVFATPELAAIDALNYINGKSICENREYGGYIYKKWDWFGLITKPSYTYDEPRKGELASVNLGRRPIFHETVSAYHTHGGYDPRYDNENFSPPDKDLGDAMQVATYLGTPSRAIKLYMHDPKKNRGGKVDTIGKTPECECKK